MKSGGTLGLHKVSNLNELSEVISELPPYGPRLYIVSDNYEFENQVKNMMVPAMREHLPNFRTGGSAPIFFVFDTSKFDMHDVLRAESHRDLEENSTTFNEIMKSLNEIANRHTIGSLNEESRLELFTALIHVEQLLQSKKFKFLAHHAIRLERIRVLMAKIKELLQSP